MEYKYISPIKLLIVYGILGVIITSIIGTISSFIECNNINIALKICKIKTDNNETYLENIKVWLEDIYDYNIYIEIFLLLIGIIVNYFYRLFYFLIIKYLNAIHIIFSNLIYTTFLIWIGYMNTSNKYKENNVDNVDNVNKEDANRSPIFKVIVQIIVTLGIVIYLEMIELDFCNLNYNTKKSIIERSIEEYELKSNSEGEQDFNLNDSLPI